MMKKMMKKKMMMMKVTSGQETVRRRDVERARTWGMPQNLKTFGWVRNIM
jgi:hypothetical protein